MINVDDLENFFPCLENGNFVEFMGEENLNKWLEWLRDAVECGASDFMFCITYNDEENGWGNWRMWVLYDIHENGDMQMNCIFMPDEGGEYKMSIPSGHENTPIWYVN